MYIYSYPASGSLLCLEIACLAVFQVHFLEVLSTNSPILQFSNMSNDPASFLGVFLIPMEQLRDPTEDYRVRPVSMKAVTSLSKAMASREESIFLSTFIVMVVKTQNADVTLTQDNVKDHHFMVIDGNHRLEAMRLINLKNGVHCYVYNDITPLQAVGLGYRRNTQDENVNRMSELERCAIIRRLMGGKEKKAGYAAAYQCLNIKDVSVPSRNINDHACLNLSYKKTYSQRCRNVVMPIHIMAP